ncbi:hypothetical protein ACHAQJ_009830 [Trichoderma viride]
MGNYPEKWQWHPEELWHFLESSLPRILLTRSVWLFADALDECGEIHAKDLVRKFKSLLEKSASSLTCPEQLRICFSCRHYPIISSHGLFEICLEIENRADISTYVQSEFSPFGELKLSIVPDLIINHSSGIFLWARRVVKRVQNLELSGAGLNKILTAVGSIPKGLDELYNELIRGMGSTSLKLIQWVCFATRPMSIEELRWAMVIDANCPSLHACKKADNYIPDVERMKQQIIKLSQGLAEVTPESDTQVVQFIHQTVKDFFIDKGLSALNGGLVSTNTAIGMAHFQLSRTCICYLAMEEIGQITGHGYNQMKVDFPFLYYATTSWVTHTKQSDAQNIPQEDILDLFAWPSTVLMHRWTRIYQEMDRYSYDCPPKQTELVHIMARYQILGGLNPILQSVDQIIVDVDSKNTNSQTPLSWAARIKDGAVAKLLLTTSHIEIKLRDKYSLKLLQKAVVKLLLTIGQAKADLKDENGQTPLSWAARNGHEAVVKLLLLTIGQAKVDVIDKDGQTPLSLAAENGHEAVVKLLLATGQVEINLRDGNGQTPLSLAAENGHEAVVKLLLATDQAEINSRGGNGQTPLLSAVKNRHEAVVELLLATGQAAINLGDENDQTPLSQAVKNKHETVVKILLATGQAEINLGDENDQTPLSLAAMDGHEAIVKFLLATGQAKINLRDKNGWTPMTWAAENGRVAIVEVLLATGQVNVDVIDRFGHTPLSRAARNGYGAVLKLLEPYTSHPPSIYL